MPISVPGQADHPFRDDADHSFRDDPDQLIMIVGTVIAMPGMVIAMSVPRQNVIVGEEP